MSRDLIDSMSAEYRRYKNLGEGALAQATDEELSRISSPDDNSLATIVWHIAGNLKSRFTDFETTDGEKPWRHRDEEFEARRVSRDELLTKWNSGWAVLQSALAALDDSRLHDTVFVRGVEFKVHEALHRSLAHFSSFVLSYGLLDFGQLFRFQLIHRSHARSVSSLLIYFERLLSSHS